MVVSALTNAPDPESYAATVGAEWRDLLSSDPDEVAVQRFMELHPAILPGAHDLGPTGNHPPLYGAVFRQARLEGLGTNRYPDFMWISKSTAFITPVRIEIEKPSKRWFTKAGTPTAEFTEAQGQLAEWRAWFSDETNVANFKK